MEKILDRILLARCSVSASFPGLNYIEGRMRAFHSLQIPPGGLQPVSTQIVDGMELS